MALVDPFWAKKGCFEVVSDFSCGVSKVFQRSHGSVLGPIELLKLLDTQPNQSDSDFSDVQNDPRQLYIGGLTKESKSTIECYPNAKPC